MDQKFVLERRDGRYSGVVDTAITSAHWKVLLEDESRVAFVRLRIFADGDRSSAGFC
jgi:hypothetical protein